MVVKASRLSVALGLAALAAVAHAADTYTVRGACRDGYAHGVYELRDAAGKLRAQGAFNRGARTSSFIYWSANGIRIAHVPYDDGVVSGTVAMWYAQTLPGREARQKLEAAYANGQRHGLTRSWFPNGRPRGEYVYENGTLAGAKAWNAVGVALSDEAARKQAQRDADEDAKFVASLDATVEANLPACEAAAANGTKS
jgi:antitoxin component YwqK of YwqJK toxin-antitoxin module